MASTSQVPDQISLYEEQEDPDIVVPLDYIIQRTHVVLDDIPIDEESLYTLSKAVEFFTRYLMQVGSINKTSEITYDSIAEVINLSQITTLKDFFPRRQFYGHIAAKVAEAEVQEQQNQQQQEHNHEQRDE
ncbi:unnamed protein product [Caenorhabditis angaria]|uniref:Transcription factor CBF/NF-Y/archaeal histone domain-containing protein n=1 Tax=Caenorhabditis angaria TaxID=860376 RepID=A0A9P1N2G6_9PELO|nr:unnamed protein product [Caenorhabditis angaria]